MGGLIIDGIVNLSWSHFDRSIFLSNWTEEGDNDDDEDDDEDDDDGYEEDNDMCSEYNMWSL